jgi:hypothetical protein
VEEYINGNAVAWWVGMLCYTPEGCGFESLWGHCIFIFHLFNHSSHTMTLRLTQPLIEMNTRNPSGGGGGGRMLPSRKHDNLTAICEPVVY